MTTLNLLKGNDAIRSGIAQVRTHGASYRQSVQTAGLSIVAHASEHGDVSLLPELLDAVNKSSRNAVWAWFKAHAPVSFDKETGKVKLRKGWKPEDFNVDAMAETNWDDFKVAKKSSVTEVTAAAFIVAEKARLVKIASGQADSETRTYTDAAKKAAKGMMEALSTMFSEAELVVAGERAAKRLNK